ncbi:Lrp/AsnC family transcriptional regulator [Streptomyces sp. NBC_00006]|uniref:Lrp/AsnC family transcriptional regulator n=1 Tax=unclassified Streptomyces TaxID=2593676 RepID=UPI0022572958|nr:MULTISPECIES: Lrp/AsnC family transcriptional regulator [unclassified Streptomyces]MCX5531548.1 Lrp/AsnC family transcriptional regulator [Streptomyces sp. NBC_00006]
MTTEQNPTARPAPLDGLDRRIVAALQIDGRASWRRIADVLGEPERKVARRGHRLVESGDVAVRGLVVRGETVILRMNCRPGSVREAALATARRPDVVFSYVLAGVADCVAELQCPPGQLGRLMLDEVPALPGLVQQQVSPVLRYFRTVHEWSPGILDDAEVEALGGAERPDDRVGLDDVELAPDEEAILRALAADGRCTNDELAAVAGVSVATARRRVEALSRAGTVSIRAVVEPALLGLPVQALLWIRTRPGEVEEVGRLLVESPLVRYAAVVMGEHQLLVDVTQPSKEALHAFLTEAPWVRRAESVQSHLVVEAWKRSGVSTVPTVRGSQGEVSTV